MAGTWSRHTAPSISAYISALPASEARSLRRLRDAILAAAPGGVEVISYRVPGVVFPNGGRIHFGVRRGGLSLYAGHVSKSFANELKGFTVSGTTIHFTSDHELPIALIKRITKKIISNADERAAARATRRR